MYFDFFLFSTLVGQVTNDPFACCVSVACQGSRPKAQIRYFVGFVELPCLSAALGNDTQYKVRLYVESLSVSTSV